MSKIALFFLLDKPSFPENFGIKMSLEALAPLYDTLLRDSSLTKLAYPESTAYCLRLFRKPFQSNVLIVLKDFDYHTGTDLENACRNEARKILELAPDKEFCHESYVRRALWLPRGVTRLEFMNLAKAFSKSVEVDTEQLGRHETLGGWLMPHPDGYIFGSKNEADFLRSLVCQALSLAYQQQSAQAIDRLSLASTSGGSQLPKMIEDINRFRSQYYFNNPIKTGAGAEKHEYQVLSEHMGLPQLSHDLDSKIMQILSFLQARQLNGQVDDLESMSADRTQRATAGAKSPQPSSSHQNNSFGRLLIGLVLLAVLGSAAYLLATDAGQAQLNEWLGAPQPTVLDSPSNQ